MLFKKKGMPEEDELVLCTITKIHYHSVFANLDEYSKSGMIHISEISPGRIRNISDFVQEGKKVVCKILRIDEQKGHIDLSLRRVNEKQKKKKIEQIKQEQKAEKILEGVAHKHKLDIKKLYIDTTTKAFEKYDTLHDFFLAVVKNQDKLETCVSKKICDDLNELIKQRIRLPEVIIKADLELVSYEPNGIEIIKDVLIKLEKEGPKIKYKGGGKFSLEIKSPNYKTAEAILEKVQKKGNKLMTENNFKIIRKDG